MRNHPLNLSESQDPEPKLLNFLNLLRTFKMIRRIVEPLKSKTQSKKSKRFFKMRVKSYHKKFQANSLRIFSIEATMTILDWQIKTSSFKFRV